MFTQVLYLAHGMHSWGMSPMRWHDSQYSCRCKLPSLLAKALPFSSNSPLNLFLFLFPGCSKVYYALHNVPRLPTSPNFISIFNLFPQPFPLVVKSLPGEGQAQCFLSSANTPNILLGVAAAGEMFKNM